MSNPMGTSLGIDAIDIDMIYEMIDEQDEENFDDMISPNLV